MYLQSSYSTITMQWICVRKSPYRHQSPAYNGVLMTQVSSGQMQPSSPSFNGLRKTFAALKSIRSGFNQCSIFC